MNERRIFRNDVLTGRTGRKRGGRMSHPSQDWIMENESELIEDWFISNENKRDEFYAWAEQEYNDRMVSQAEHLNDLARGN